MEGGMKKYGLQLRIPRGQSSSKPAPTQARPPPPSSIFGGDDDDDVEKEISRHQSKTSSLQKIEEQRKKALEEDPSVFDYDGVYDEMKEKIAKPKLQDKSERKSKYIERLMAKAKEREREHEIIYERKLIKERSKEDHLYGDKEKFVTSAYRKKLAEQAKWLEEERLRELREERDDVTKKKDMSEFYFGLSKNVALGAQTEDPKLAKQEPEPDDTQEIVTMPSKNEPGTSNRTDASTEEEEERKRSVESPVEEQMEGGGETSTKTKDESKMDVEKTSTERFKRSGQDISSLREKYLARKKAKEQL